MITFELIKDKTVYNGQEFTDLCAAARYVVCLHEQDQPFQAFRGAQKCLTGKSIRKIAKLRILDEKYVKHA